MLVTRAVGVVLGVQQPTVLILGILRQMAVRRVDICSAHPIRRDSVKMLIPAARLLVANVSVR
jgi:hypothetical protein